MSTSEEFESMVYNRIAKAMLEEVAKRYRTPLYVYDAEIIKTRYLSLRKVFPENVDIFYSFKANSNVSICAYLRCLGAGAEIASLGELCIAKLAGFPSEKIIFASPGKTDNELRNAIEYGIFLINAESMAEIEKVDKIAGSYRKEVNINLRVNPKHTIKNALYPMGGGSAKLGIDEEKLEDVLVETKSMKHVNVVGIHAHMASQVSDYKALLEAQQKIIDVALRIFTTQKQPLKVIDIGGGFGVPHKSNPKLFDLKKYGKGLCKIIEAKSKQYNMDLGKVRFLVEPGRYIVGPAGFYLTSIIYIKESRGTKYFITDGGVNHIRKQIFGEEGEARVLGRKSIPVESVDVAGPLCLAEDIIARDMEAPKSTQIGDVVIISNAGAYGFASSPLYFLSHPLPAEVLIYQKMPYLIRERGTFKDFVKRQKILEF